MNGVGYLFLLVAGVLLLKLPRRWAPLPLLVSAAYIGIGEQLEIGPAHFTINRLLVIIGFLRVWTKREHLAGGWQPLDRLMLIWALWAIVSSFLHSTFPLVFRLGMVLDTFGLYIVLRALIHEPQDFVLICKVVSVTLVPLGAAMVFEKLTGTNCFEFLGGAAGSAELRNGHYRARGPFTHQILGGTIGGACVPMALLLWRENRKIALAGLFASLGIVIASGSSGPIMTTFSVFFALGLWNLRSHLKKIRWLFLLLIIALDIVMNDPVYYLLARIDITGGSTGWHRAALIDSAIKHLGEWWMAGTDITRHWMPTGIPANQANTDITNHFLQIGVWGGLPLMLLFIWILAVAFKALGRQLRVLEDSPVEDSFLIWTLGAILFGHVTTFLSIAYFDHQSVVFLYLVLAAIASLCSGQTSREAIASENPQEVPDSDHSSFAVWEKSRSSS